MKCFTFKLCWDKGTVVNTILKYNCIEGDPKRTQIMKVPLLKSVFFSKILIIERTMKLPKMVREASNFFQLEHSINTYNLHSKTLCICWIAEQRYINILLFSISIHVYYTGRRKSNVALAKERTMSLLFHGPDWMDCSEKEWICL